MPSTLKIILFILGIMPYLGMAEPCPLFTGPEDLFIKSNREILLMYGQTLESPEEKAAKKSSFAKVYVLRMGNPSDNPVPSKIIITIIDIPLKDHDVQVKGYGESVGDLTTIFGQLRIDDAFDGEINISIDPESLQVIGANDLKGINLHKGDSILITNFYGQSIKADIRFDSDKAKMTLGLRTGVQIALINPRKVEMTPAIYLKLGLNVAGEKRDSGIRPSVGPMGSFELRL